MLFTTYSTIGKSIKRYEDLVPTLIHDHNIWNSKSHKLKLSRLDSTTSTFSLKKHEIR